jgi:hypothetical protein
MTPEEDPNVESSEAANTSRALLRGWLASVRKDPDLGKDIRMMVPIFYDQDRQKTKVWAVLGIATKPLTVSYNTPPTVKEIKGPDGKRVNAADVKVEFYGEGGRIAYIATAEVYVTHLLNRTEFRQLCDRQKTYKAIVDSLK